TSRLRCGRLGGVEIVLSAVSRRRIIVVPLVALFADPLLFFFMLPLPPGSTLFPYTTLFRSQGRGPRGGREARAFAPAPGRKHERSEEHTSELQSHLNLVCRLLLEKKNPHGRHRLHGNAQVPSHTPWSDVGRQHGIQRRKREE